MRLRVIVVDDEPASAAALAGLLRHLRCEVTSFTGAARALPSMLAPDVDLVCLDLRMPGLDGRQALTLIRSHEYSARSPSVPVIAVSGRVTSDDRAQALADGFAAFLAKPVLVARLRVVLGRAMLLRDHLQRTRYTVDRHRLEERLGALQRAGTLPALQAAAGLALAFEQEGRTTLLQALQGAHAGDLASTRRVLLAFAATSENLGALKLAATLRIAADWFEQGSQDDGVTAAVMARAELDRVVFTLREQVRPDPD
jgi:CheY-like chemotaxis protein